MISQTHVNTLLNATFGISDIDAPTNLYMGLCVSEPNHENGKLDGCGEPTSHESYERKNVADCFGSFKENATGNPTASATAAGGIITNIKEIQMKTIRDTALGTMKYWFLSYSSTGNAIIWGKINGDNGVNIAENTVPVFYEGELKASIDVAL